MTVTVTVLSQVRCQVQGLDKKTLKLIDEALSIEQPGARFQEAVRSGRWDGKKHLFYAPSCTFPKGLLSRTLALLTEAGVEYVVDDQRVLLPPPDLTRLTPEMLSTITLRSYQMKAARKSLKAGCGIIWIATNGGKSAIAAAMMRVLKERRCLFLVPKRVLLDQTRAYLATYFGTIEEHIGVIGEGRFEPKHITVATVQSLTYKGSPQKAKVIASYLKTIELVFLDEGHKSRANTFYKLMNRIPAQYRYILSGTPFGSGNGLMVEACVGPVVARISNKTLIKLGVSAVPTIKMIEITTPKLDAGSSWPDVYRAGIVHNEVRNTHIATQAAAFAKDGKPTLILIKELWHGDLIGGLLKNLGVKYRFVHGKMPSSVVEQEKARFEEGKFSVLIASTIFDEGVSIPEIRALIPGDGGKSVRSVLQKLGRGLRRKTGANVVDIVDFIDLTHPWLADHSQQRVAIYDGEGFRVVT